MASRKITDLHPLLQERYKAFEIECERQKLDYLVTCTYRSGIEQDQLYAQGRTTFGRIVTCAKAGDSAHNVTTADGKPNACAFDVVIMRDGKPIWDSADKDWHSIGAVGLILGLDWAGVWKTFREYPHFQLTNWRQYCVENSFANHASV